MLAATKTEELRTLHQESEYESEYERITPVDEQTDVKKRQYAEGLLCPNTMRFKEGSDENEIEESSIEVKPHKFELPFCIFMPVNESTSPLLLV